MIKVLTDIARRLKTQSIITRNMWVSAFHNIFIKLFENVPFSRPQNTLPLHFSESNVT